MDKRKLHIDIFTDSYRPSINGVTTSIDHLTVRLAQRGHRFTIISPTLTDQEKPLHKNISHISVPSVPAAYYEDFHWSTLRITKIMEKLKGDEVDIVHFMTPIFTSYLGIKIARKLDIPVVGTYHTLIADPTYYEQLLNSIIRTTSDTVWYYTNLYYNAADLVTAPTQNMVDLLEEHGCTTDKIALSNGIDPTLFDNSRSGEVKKKYGLGDNTILYVGRVSTEKNINTLIDAFDRANETIPDAQLLIVGDGPKRKDIEEYASRKKSASRIIFTGMIPHEELVTSGIFGACRLFATFSETETQGITLLEALHCGLPCIGADALGVSETITHEKTGFLIPPRSVEAMSERMIQLLQDHELRQRMSEEAKIWVKDHYIDAIISRWESIYIDLDERYRAGEIEKKDYLHIKKIFTTVKGFKVELPLLKNFR
ncbi:MAG: glycosyltransferase [Spirochaetales bacterium]|nr:glycosyltransferase [Spirochaetales bacterium]